MSSVRTLIGDIMKQLFATLILALAVNLSAAESQSVLHFSGRSTSTQFETFDDSGCVNTASTLFTQIGSSSFASPETGAVKSSTTWMLIHVHLNDICTQTDYNEALFYGPVPLSDIVIDTSLQSARLKT